MSLFYSETKQYKEALHYHDMVDEINDSLFLEKTQQLLADLQTKHELDQKQKEIALLNTENEMHIMEVKEYRKTAIFFGSAFLVISSLLVFLVWQYNLRRKAYKKLVQKNIELVKTQKMMNGNGKNRNKNTLENDKAESENALHKELQDKIKKYLKNEKPYLQSELTIKDVAEKLDTNTHYLSEVFNRSFENSFTGLINEYRVKEACRLLLEENMDNLTIESIAHSAGFNSKSAFNVAFKKITGVTPSFYMKSVKKEIN